MCDTRGDFDKSGRTSLWQIMTTEWPAAPFLWHTITSGLRAQGQKAVAASFSSKQLLPSGFADLLRRPLQIPAHCVRPWNDAKVESLASGRDLISRGSWCRDIASQETRYVDLMLGRCRRQTSIWWWLLGR